MLTFVRELIRNSNETGAFLPSSPTFAKVITRSVRREGPPRRILEVGPGSGPMTRYIVKALRPGDAYDLVEISQAFADLVERNFLEPTRQRMPDATIKIHCGPVQDVELEPGYDIIISSLPFNNFDFSLVQTILARYEELLGPNGELHFWEYMGFRYLGMMFPPRKRRERLSAITRYYKGFDRQPDTRKSHVWLNVPPATYRSLCRTATASAD